MVDTKTDQIVKQVMEKLQSRSQVGVKKYGTTIWDNTDENYMKHLQDELLDGANYCEQMMRMGQFAAIVATLVESESNDMMLGARIRSAYRGIKEQK